MKKYNKTNKLIAGAFFVGLAAMSCSKFLEVAPQGAITEQEISTNPSAAQDLVTSVYNIMWQGGLHGVGFVGMTNIASDDADKGSHPTDGAATMGRLDDLSQWDPSITTLDQIWSGHFAAIARANQALAYITLSPADEIVKNRLTGEVRFLRAYFYFNLVRFFGGVPKIDEVPPLEEINNPSYQQKATKEEIYELIVGDLEFAVENLPIKGDGGTQLGRANKGAATGMLAKVFLYQQNWQRAYELSSQLVNGQVGNYDLLANYEDIWRHVGANSVESLFEVQTGVNAACTAAIDNYAFSQGPRGSGPDNLGWGFGTPSESLTNAYEEGDQRREATIIFINPDGNTVLWDGYTFPGTTTTNERYNYKSYHSRVQEPNCAAAGRLPKNLRILRFGEVLLIHAEAALATGNVAEAMEDINRLRLRAGIAPLSMADISREAIWNERRVELGMEHDRYFDLVRQEAIQPGRAVQAFEADGKVWVKGRHELFPIPQNQIQLSEGELAQNPGY
ncbi:RagB/SusD family nutrient uptake outer membrane protein [Olivibacter sp. SDN3]|uniref:RagB/SusD family nutrient uptake outer membrane protein n=1 Tax=Olivibacter sp. SDN3 TaxID=2764720 RepID=UPI0016515482|nr:RagB/SusD family nutrient uptake outer membrane protein [Olivibacter sp. SDN3]QNL51224.1 RagB/SusD family nutrient uptake outer membrane protein [Olivibacter sp. SDN3]